MRQRPLRLGERTDLDLTGGRAHGQVGDEIVLGLSRASGDDRRVPRTSGLPDHVHRLGQRPDLVHLHEHRVRDAAFDPAFEPRGVRAEEVVADELDAPAEPLGQDRPAVPVVLREPVLDRDERVVAGERDELLDERGRVEPRGGLGEQVALAVEEVAGGDVDRQADLVPRRTSGARDRVDEQLERRFGVVERRPEAALGGLERREPALAQQLPGGATYGRSPLERLPQRAGPDGDDQEVLEREPRFGVEAAADHVHHRRGQNAPAAELAPERDATRRRRRACQRGRDGEQRVGAEPRLVLAAVELDEQCVEGALIERAAPEQRRGDRLADVRDRAEHPVAAVARPGRRLAARAPRAGRSRCPRARWRGRVHRR